jgi:putative flippase GtrA
MTGAVLWRIASFLQVESPLGVPLVTLVLFVPMLWMGGVILGEFLGISIPFFRRFGRFCVIGFSNSAVDLGALYTLIGLTGYATGWHYTLFKTISFILAVSHSFYWNKHWTFNASSSNGETKEAAKFFGVNFIALLANVSIASAVISTNRPLVNTENALAGLGAIAGGAAALVFTFVSAHLYIFPHRSPTPSDSPSSSNN